MQIDEGMDVGLAAASQSGAAYRATDADLALAELFGGEVGEILGSGNGIRSRGGPQEFYCLIQGCVVPARAGASLDFQGCFEGSS